MTQSPGGLASTHDTQNSQSTPEVARNEATDVARTAARSGGEVAGTVGDQARRVTAETTQQARNLLEEGKNQLTDQARDRQRKAAESLHTLSDQLREMSQTSDGTGLAPELVQQAAERTRTVASWLEQHEPGDLLTEVRTFARRKPGVFLAGAALAGILAGRLTRGVVAAQSESAPDSASDGPPSGPPSPPQATPAYRDEPVGLPAEPTMPGYSVPPSGPATPPGPVTP
jgi:hypothetical protein